MKHAPLPSISDGGEDRFLRQKKWRLFSRSSESRRNSLGIRGQKAVASSQSRDEFQGLTLSLFWRAPANHCRLNTSAGLYIPPRAIAPMA